MMNKLLGTFLGKRFPQIFGGLAFLFVVSYLWQPLFTIVQFILVAAILAVVLDFILLYSNWLKFSLSREVKAVLSLGDSQKTALIFNYQAPFKIGITILDELPYQLEIRDLSISDTVEGEESKTYVYTIRPTTRGVYEYGNTHLYVQSFLGLLERKYTFTTQRKVQVFPSILQMKHYELSAVRNNNQFSGIKKLRRLGHSYEFEQIKNYVPGDDYRSVNWKATSRSNSLMVNQFQDEKSQSIYFIIDKGRSMKLPFDGMSLLDYSINSTLAVSNIGLKKGDKVGLITLREQVDTILKADSGSLHLRKIYEALYKEEPGKLEPNFEMLYSLLTKVVRTRSLLFLFTNIESENTLLRILPLLRAISKRHLLVVVLFENSGLDQFSKSAASHSQEVYFKVAAKKRIYDKKLLVKIMQTAGINAVLSQPKELSVNTINKYLELKSRGMI